MAKSSLSYIWYRCSVGEKALDMNPHGFRSPLPSYCRSTAPEATFDASVSSTNDFVLSGINRIGLLRNDFFRVWNASSHSGVHPHGLLDCLIPSNGLAMSA